MRISQKLEYACRALAQLAKHHDGRTLIRLEDLAQREAISANFLVQILNDLRRGGIVESRRGKAGGYLLARQPSTITLREIIEVVDPALLHPSVGQDGDSGPAVRETFEQISKSLRSSLEATSLDAIARRGEQPMFYI